MHSNISEEESLGSPWLLVHIMLDHRPLVTTTKDRHNEDLKYPKRWTGYPNDPGQIQQLSTGINIRR